MSHVAIPPPGVPPEYRRPLGGARRVPAWIVERAGLEGAHLHDLRHTHGSTAGGANLSVVMIAKLLGHKQTSTAERYIHPEESPVRRAAELVAGEIEAALNGKQQAPVVKIR